MTLREKVLKGEMLCGTHISTGDFITADILSQCGFDFIWIDTEHSCMDYRELLSCISIIRARGIPVVVRVHKNDHAHTKRVLEMGVDGIIFPYVESIDEAKEVIASCLYPPDGFRGFGPLGAVNYGLRSADEYIKSSSDELAIFLQVESKKTVESLPSICKLPHADGFILGPCDMSGSIGRLGEVCGKENMELIRQSVKILQSEGKYAGVSIGSIDADVQKFWIELGFKFISSGTDYDYLCVAASNNAKQLHSLISGGTK